MIIAFLIVFVLSVHAIESYFCRTGKFGFDTCQKDLLLLRRKLIDVRMCTFYRCRCIVLITAISTDIPTTFDSHTVLSTTLIPRK